MFAGCHKLWSMLLHGWDVLGTHQSNRNAGAAKANSVPRPEKEELWGIPPVNTGNNDWLRDKQGPGHSKSR